MSLDCLYKDIQWCHTSFHKSDECFCEGNLIVPDAMGDIAKIISVRSQPSVSESKTEAGRIVVTGQTKINVLYISEDDSSKICTLTTSVPFSHVINAPDVTDEYISIVNTVSSSCSYTVVNSRRLKVTTLLRLCAESYKNNRLKVLHDAKGAQVKAKEVALSSARAICQKNIVVTATADLPSGRGAISKILISSAYITDKDFKVLNNKVIVKGSISASLLYLSDDDLTDATVSVPFTEVIEAEGVSPSLDTEICLSVADCEILPDTDLSGDYKMLDITVILTVSVRSFTKETVRAVTDIYLPGGAIKTQANTMTVKTASKQYHQEEFVKEALTLSKGLPNITRVIDVSCHLTDLSVSDNTISATAEATIMYLSGDSSSPVNTFTAKIPITHKSSLDNPSNPQGEITHISYALTGENTLEVRFGVDFALSSAECDTLTLFTLCEETDYTPSTRPSIVVSFVNKGDTLWDIAKKYNIALSHLASANALDEDAILTVGEKLIIPR